MKALVTGGGGFLGRYIVELLHKEGFEVLSLSRKAYSFDVPIKSVQASIRFFDSIVSHFEGVDVVFHTAAQVGVWGKWEDFYQTNVIGTQNVVQACRKHGVSRLVFTSSPSVVFDGTDQRGLDESAPYPNEWLSHYPHTKMLSERFVLEQNGKKGLYTTALRPHLIWGRRDTHLIPRLIERASQGKLRFVGDQRNRVDITHVENAARAHVLAAKNLGSTGRCNGKAYFLSQDEPVNLWDFVNGVLERSNTPPIRKSISFKKAYAVGALLEKVHRLSASPNEPRMTRFVAQQLARDHYYDVSAAKKDFGYEPWVSTEQGMNELFPS